MNKKITFISDTHTKHKTCEADLPGGDILIHAGDIMNSGYSSYEIEDFLAWFRRQDYDNLIFIAGNHDRLFENKPDLIQELLSDYDDIDYLEDNGVLLDNDIGTLVWGSPWQPEFYNWAFNLPRSGSELESKWEMIPDNVDILVTHGPPQGYLDTSGYGDSNLGCELLREKIDIIKPKIHVFGHIHGSAGYMFNGGTHFFNASILNERYNYHNRPMTIDWDSKTNEIEFI